MRKSKKLKVRKKIITAKELRRLLKNRKIILDCGHKFQLHPWSNTLIMTADGETCCHNCY